MIRRAIAVIVIAASAFFGLASTANAGELCVKLLPTFSDARFCFRTE